MTEMIAYCGLDCSGCDGYLATQADDDTMRAETAKAWSALYNADIKPEDVNCDGCSADGRKIFYCSDICEIRKCGVEKGVLNCAGCEDYSCEKLEAFFQVAPQARGALDGLRS